MTPEIGPPSLLNSFTEAARTTLEFWLLQASYKHLKVHTPKGDPRVILVLPGFGAGDITTHQLRRVLSDEVHHAYGWKGGVNKGPGKNVFQHLKSRLNQLVDDHDGSNITLIGHSLGGIYARELARAIPNNVEQVLTLGSPFGAGLHPHSTNILVRKAFELVNGKDHPLLQNHDMARQCLMPPPVPTTSIYSRGDGVVHWKTCINPKQGKSENVEVSGSHCGLVLNPLSFIVIADRLSQSPAAWTPFTSDAYGPLLFRADQAHHSFEPKVAGKRSKSPLIDFFGI